MWHYAFLKQDGRDVKKLKSFGYDEEAKAWFFANGGYYQNQFYPAQDRLVWVGDQGFMLPQGLDNKDEDLLPPTLSEQETNITISEIHSHLRAVQDPHYTKVILGWALGNFFIPEILKEFKVLPFLFIYGKAQAGKSTLANWVSSFYGFTQKGSPYFSSSVVGISRAVANYSMIPFWLDEYRNNDTSGRNKAALLRSIYDKSTIVKGTVVEDEIKTYKPRSTLIISGEEPPRDAALNSRCVLIPVYDRQEVSDKESFQWLQNNAINFNLIGHHILMNKEKYWQEIKGRIHNSISQLESEKYLTDYRNKLHLSIIVGVCDVFLGKSDNFSQFISKEALSRTKIIFDSQAIYVFLEDILNKFNTNEIDFDFIRIVRKFKKSDGVLYENICALAFNSLYSFWEKNCLRLREDMPVTQAAMLEHFKHEPYFIAINPVKLNQKSIRCLLFDAEHPKFPEQLKSILLSMNENFKEAIRLDEDDVLQDDTQFNNHILLKNKGSQYETNKHAIGGEKEKNPQLPL